MAGADSDQVCGAKTRKGEPGYPTPCQEPPIPGVSRCKRHGGLSTGPRTAEGKARAAASPIKNGKYVNVMASYLRQLGIPDDLWNEIPDDTDLSSELKLLRANLVRYAAWMAQGVHFLRSSSDRVWRPVRGPLTPEQAAAVQQGTMTEDEVRPPPDTDRELILSVDLLYSKTLEEIRKMAKTQHDIHPAKDVGGNFKFIIEVSEEATKAADADEKTVPILTEQGDPDDNEPLSAAETVARADDEDAPRTGYEDD